MEFQVSVDPDVATADRALLVRARRNCPTDAIDMADANGDPAPDEEGDR